MTNAKYHQLLSMVVLVRYAVCCWIFQLFTSELLNRNRNRNNFFKHLLLTKKCKVFVNRAMVYKKAITDRIQIPSTTSSITLTTITIIIIAIALTTTSTTIQQQDNNIYLSNQAS